MVSGGHHSIRGVRASALDYVRTKIAMRFRSSSHETGQFDRPRIEGRRGPASESAVVSPDQPVCKIGSAVLPEVKCFLDRGLVFELELRGVEQSGDGAHDLSFLQTVSAAQQPFGLQQDQ